MRLTSALLTNAILFAKSDPGMADALQKRDNDDNLYLAGVICRMQRYTDNPGRFFLRITFDYAAFNDPATNQPDIFVDLTTFADGTFKVLPPPPRDFVDLEKQDAEFR